jgi:hypothetical protein
MMPLLSACVRIIPNIVKSVLRKNRATFSSSIKKPTESSLSIKQCSFPKRIETIISFIFYTWLIASRSERTSILD